MRGAMREQWDAPAAAAAGVHRMRRRAWANAGDALHLGSPRPPVGAARTCRWSPGRCLWLPCWAGASCFCCTTCGVPAGARAPPDASEPHQTRGRVPPCSRRPDWPRPPLSGTAFWHGCTEARALLGCRAGGRGRGGGICQRGARRGGASSDASSAGRAPPPPAPTPQGTVRYQVLRTSARSLLLGCCRPTDATVRCRSTAGCTIAGTLASCRSAQARRGPGV